VYSCSAFFRIRWTTLAFSAPGGLLSSAQLQSLGPVQILLLCLLELNIPLYDELNIVQSILPLSPKLRRWWPKCLENCNKIMMSAKARWLLYTALTYDKKNSPFSPHIASIISFIWYSVQNAITSLNSIKQVFSVMKTSHFLWSRNWIGTTIYHQFSSISIKTARQAYVYS